MPMSLLENDSIANNSSKISWCLMIYTILVASRVGLFSVFLALTFIGSDEEKPETEMPSSIPNGNPEANSMQNESQGSMKER